VFTDGSQVFQNGVMVINTDGTMMAGKQWNNTTFIPTSFQNSLSTFSGGVFNLGMDSFIVTYHK
jgi:hypothetical protein